MTIGIEQNAESWNTAWGYLISTGVGAAIGGFAGSICLEVFRRISSRKRAKKYLVYILEEIQRGVQRCIDMKCKIDHGQISFGTISTGIWDSVHDLDPLAKIAGTETIKKMMIIYEWFGQVKFNAMLERPDRAGAYAQFAIEHERIDSLYKDIILSLSKKI